MIDKIKGGLFGVAVGDALGGALEFMNPKEIQKKHGYVTEMIGGGPWFLYPGEITDDTMMTIALAEGIIEEPNNPIQKIGERFVEWFNTDPIDIGVTIRFSISMYLEEKSWERASKRTHDYLKGKSAGNGSLMRCLPIALAYSDPSKIVTISNAQSKMTHYDHLASEACIIYNKIAYKMLEGIELKQAIEEEVKGTRYESVLFEQPYGDPDGFVVNSLSWSLYILLNTSSFEEVVQKAANMGFDADTTSAIAGGLAGIHYGYESIPERYRNIIMVKDKLHVLSEQLLQVRNY